MADRFPLILNTSNNQIQEIASGDNLDLTGTGINNAGIITAGNVTIGAATTDLVVNGDARITGILTIGTSSLKLDGPNNLVNVGTALTLGHTQGLQFHTQNLHSAGFEVNQINVSGITTIGGKLDTNGVIEAIAGENKIPFLYANMGALPNAGTYHGMFAHVHSEGKGYFAHAGAWYELVNKDTNGNVALNKDLDVDGHTNLDNISVAGVSTFTGNSDFSAGIDVTGNATVSGNLSVGGVLTYEDVTNVDSVGIITARSSIKLDADGSASSNFLSIGADDDLKIFHQSNVDKIESSANGFHIRQINGGDIHIHAGANTGASNNRIVARTAGQAELYYSGNKKFETASYGVKTSGEIEIASGHLRGDSTNGLRMFSDSTATKGIILNTDDHLIPSNDSASDLGTNSVRWRNVYADTLYGDGSNLTGLSGVSVANQSNNRLITATGTTDALNAESNLTFDSGRLTTQAVTINDNGVSGVIFDVRADDQSPWMLHFGNDSYHGDGGLWAYQSNGGAFEIRARGNNEYINLDFNRWNGSTNQNWLRLNANGAVNLYYQGAAKFETRSTGVSVYDTLAVGTAGLQVANVASFRGGTNNQLNIADGGNTSWGLLLTQSQASGGYHTTTNSGVSKPCAVVNVNNDSLYLGTNNTARWRVEHDGHFIPFSNGSYDIGSSGRRVRNVYTNDLNLSNEGGKNDVDGTWGNYTIQEGESDLFLINNRSGKKYKFNLTEVS